MGPVEADLRSAPSVLEPNWDNLIHAWLWGWDSHGFAYRDTELHVLVMRTVSWSGGNIGLTPGHAVSEAYDDGLLSDLMSEAVEAAEALGL